LAVWKLDRLGRFLKDLLEIVTALEQRGIGFKSLQESTDTTTPGGKLIFHVFAALAEFERGVIRECTEPPDTIGFIYMLAGDTGTTNHHPHQRNTRETSA
jgi:hypothetical protein